MPRAAIALLTISLLVAALAASLALIPIFGLTGSAVLVAEQDVPTVERFLETEALRSGLPRATELRWGAEPRSAGGASYRELYVLDTDPVLSGEYLADAGPAARDPQFNQPYVPFETTRRGARRSAGTGS